MGWAEGHGVLARSRRRQVRRRVEATACSTATAASMRPTAAGTRASGRTGKPHGQGQYRRPDGKIFIGEWIDGVYEGDVEPGAGEDDDPNRT